MGKVLKVVATVVGVAALVVPGVGSLIGSALISVGVGAGIATAIVTGLGIAAFSAGISTLTGALGLGPKPPKQSLASTDRLRASLDPRASRKIVFGRTGANTDVHYQEFTGTNQDTLNTILVLSSHRVQSIDEIWFDEKLAWSSASGVTASFAGFLSVTTRTEGAPANAFTITGSSSWTSSASRMTGLAYIWLRYTLSGDNSPFASSISSRITVRTRGALVYDPRRDSTAGGSGTHRANDQTTWAWVSDDVGRNPALQLLWYLLGWRIQNPVTSQWKLAVGLGLPVDRIDLPSFIAAANICDEPVTLAAGGTEPRYRSDGVFGENDDPSVVFDNLCAAMNGVLRDNGGKLSLEILRNDLGSPVVDLGEADVIDGFTWLQTPPIDQTFNIIRGQYVDPSDASLYQPVDYPDVVLTSPDGIDRSKTFNFGMVQSASQAQRLAKTYLQRAQYPGTFTADFLASAWRCQVGSVVRLTFPALGFSNKLFRVIEHSIRTDGRCPMVLREEDASIYAWSASEAPAVTAAAPISYNPLNDPVRAALADALALAAARGKVWTTPTIPSVAESNVGDTWVAPDGTFYDRVNEGGILLGGFAVVLAGFRPQLAWTRSANQPVVAAATTALWPNITGAGKPADNATRNVVTYSAVAPSAPIDGDLWVDTSGTYAVFKLRSGGAWQTGANALTAYNALSGTPVALADINTTESAKLSGIEATADVTSAITGPAAILIDADYTGAVISSLPRTEAYKFLRNGTDLTTTSAWSVTVLRGTLSASIGAATGVLSLNLSGGVLTDAMLRITATNGGRSRSFDVAVTKLIGSPPATGASGTAASSTFSAAIASSTMVAASPELTITIGSGGTANLSASYDFETGVSGTYGLVGRWYRWNGSAYVAIGIEVNSTTNARFFPVDGISEPGSGQCNFVDTGLTAGSSQKYRFYARGADATNRNVWGSVSAVGG